MNARELPRRDYDGLKAAFRRLIGRYPSLDAAARVTRVDAARLSRYGNPHERGMYAPLDVVMDLEAHIGASDVTGYMADMLGMVLVQKQPAELQPDFARHLGSVAKESGEAVSVLASLIDPTTRTPQTVARARKEIREAEEALAGAEKVLADIEGNVVPMRRA